MNRSPIGIGIDKNLCERFTPLKSIPDNLREELLIHAKVGNFDVYSNIISHSENPLMVHFLIEGCVDIRHAFDRRKNLSSDDPNTTYPLEELITLGGNIRAITPCKVLVVNRSYLQEIQVKSRAALQHQRRTNDNTGLFLSDYIEKDHHSYWKSMFYQSPLALSLSPKQIHSVFCRLRDMSVGEGDSIIQRHSRGDHFYIVKEGQAQITVVDDKNLEQRIDVGPGGYFGEEALVSDLPRNANVVMKSQGVIGRLPKKDFIDYIKVALVRTPTLAAISSFSNPIYCDVRSAAEYKQYHTPHSINVPAGKIRQYLHTFDKKLTYVVTPEGGKKGELATYLMRQAGIDAYYMDDTLRQALMGLTEAEGILH